MLAVFCLRLALGLLFALAFLSPRLMHPRFFRTHFVTALGLSVIALISGWSYAPGIVWNIAHGPPIEGVYCGTGPMPSLEQRVFLVAAVIFTFVGSLVWIFERPIGGRVAQVLAIVAMAAALVYMQDVPFTYVTDEVGQRLETVSLPLPTQLGCDAASAALLGFTVTAMLVGHSYLISPGLTIRPLMGQILGLGIALLARTAVAAGALWFWAGDHDITNLNDINVLWLPVRWLVGLLGPLVFGWMAYRTAKIRSTQSATGILYVVVILVFLGELFGLLLTRNTGLPL